MLYSLVSARTVYSMIFAKNRSSIHRKKAKTHVIKVILLDYGIFATALCDLTENHDFNIPSTFGTSMYVGTTIFLVKSQCAVLDSVTYKFPCD